MSLSFDTDRLVVPPGVVTRAVEGRTVLLHTATGRYFTLDPIGTRAWALLTSSPSIVSARDTLLAEYDVDPGQLDRDLEELVERLEAEGLVEVRRA
jgi:hypothetical protein